MLEIVGAKFSGLKDCGFNLRGQLDKWYAKAKLKNFNYISNEWQSYDMPSYFGGKPWSDRGFVITMVRNPIEQC